MISEVEDWIIQTYGPENFAPGLGRMERAIESLKPELQRAKIVTIAGTNGKGETTHRLARLLGQKRFCAWTSPHIESITERFSCELGLISEAELDSLVKACHGQVKENGYQLSYYEFLFFVFCTWAAQRDCEMLLLEVGLGGRLDAVNTLDADVVLLTSISRDHQEFLGNRFDLILKEKLGVVREKSQLLSYLDLQYLRERVRRFAEKKKVTLTDCEDLIKIPTFAFSERNQFLAYAASKVIQGESIDVKNWTPTTERLKDRGEMIQGRHEAWLYGSHNVDGVRKLIQFLRPATYTPSDAPFTLIVTSFSKRAEKDVRVMLKLLREAQLGEVIVTSFEHPKAYPKMDLKRLSAQEGLQFVDDISEQLKTWTHQKILVVGSYYFLGQLKPLLRAK